jgi:hypothetical protein
MSYKHENYIKLILESINVNVIEKYTFNNLKEILEKAEGKIPICTNETNMRKTKCTKHVKPGYDYCPQHLTGSKTKNKSALDSEDRPPVNIDINVNKREIVKYNDVFVLKGTNMVCDERGNVESTLKNNQVVLNT